MFKHRLMLSIAAAILAAGPATAATCTGASPHTSDTHVSSNETAPLDTCTDGNIIIDSGKSVKISKPNQAVITINSANTVHNGGTIANTNAANAVGVLLDGTNGGSSGYTIPGFAFENSGTIDLSGSGTSKAGIELAHGTFTTSIITDDTSSFIKVNGDNSAGVLVASDGKLIGNIDLGGTIAMTPTSTGKGTATGDADVLIAGTVQGNVTADGSAIFSAIGDASQGIVVSPTGSITGTLTNAGNITVIGKRLPAGQVGTSSTPEGGSVLFINGNVGTGIVNSGPLSAGDAAGSAVLAGSGLTSNSVQAVVEIAPISTQTTSITIGADTADSASGQASFINRGNIIASPLSSNNTTAIYIAGNSSTITTSLTGPLFDAGLISAIASSTNAPSTNPNPFARGIVIGPFASIPKIVISGESVPILTASTTSRGTLSANVSGTGGGEATAILLDPGSNVPEIDITDPGTGGPAKILATATTTNPNSVLDLTATGIFDASDKLKTINNAGAITATVTTLTKDPSTFGFFNFARAIDLSPQTTGGVTINDAGAITGDVLLNSADTTATMTSVLNVGAGTATGAGATQVAAANAAASGTGRQNSSISNEATLNGQIFFGTGEYDLFVNDYGSVQATLVNPPSTGGTVDVGVSQHGSLVVENDTTTALVHNFTVYDTGSGAGPNLTITASEGLEGLPTILAQNTATIASGTNFAVRIGSIVPQGTHDFILLQSAPGLLNVPDYPLYASQVPNDLPFFFDRTKSSLICAGGCVGATQLIMELTPKVPGPGTPSDPGLNLKGTALQMFGPATTALADDTALGAAVANGIQDPTLSNVNTPEQVFSQFAPDVSGDIRAVAVTLTDQASGPVAARQRMLRMYANQGGDFTIWGQEFAQYFNDKANNHGEITNFKDHGFGFALGADGGDPQSGWYGGAFTFYSGDAIQAAPENSKTHTSWYMLTGYTDWRGNHLFLDTQASVAVANFRGKRTLAITDVSCGVQGQTCLREADSKRPGLMGALGATTGAIFNFDPFVVMPEIAFDGLTMREEGYTESNGGKGFNLKVQPYYANSLRAFLGADSRVDIDVGDFTVQPEARLGYRFDFLNDPVKVKAAFAATPANTFTVTGPDPSRGNVVAGATLGASTDTWSMGVNFDWVRGSNGSQTEVGTFSLLGRI